MRMFNLRMHVQILAGKRVINWVGKKREHTILQPSGPTALHRAVGCRYMSYSLNMNMSQACWEVMHVFWSIQSSNLSLQSDAISRSYISALSWSKVCKHSQLEIPINYSHSGNTKISALCTSASHYTDNTSRSCRHTACSLYTSV